MNLVYVGSNGRSAPVPKSSTFWYAGPVALAEAFSRADVRRRGDTPDTGPHDHPTTLAALIRTLARTPHVRVT
ncbi:hypothetical protein [Streptomyces sp. NPDC048825]|uniref:hypothetical protein n=1 Tax=Streptomyces sp. NPDC048825 TaxID=3365592 RepID=UPI00371605A2